MDENFFSQKHVQEVLRSYLLKVSAISVEGEFENIKRMHMKTIVNSFVHASDIWDERSQMNIKYISDAFLMETSNSVVNESSIDDFLSSCFRFVLERGMNTPGDLPRELIEFQSFMINNSQRFTSEAHCQIEYALREMPVSVVHHLIHSRRFKDYENFPLLVSEVKKVTKEWTEYLNEKTKNVGDLKVALEKHEIAFNFVGLYAGFSKLGRMKSQEYKWAKWAMFTLGGVLPIPLIGEAIYMLSTGVGNIASYSYLIKTIPIISLTLILVYYFRISLNNYNSIRAQIMQIELRKSLCRFIQSYAEYVKGIKSGGNENLLSKFEEVIFSNIMTSEEKVPSTFDGLEQLAGLIGAMKGNKGK